MVDAGGNTVTHGFILVPAARPYVQQRGCARALYCLAPGVPVVGGTSEAREGGKLPGLYEAFPHKRRLKSDTISVPGGR